MCGSPCAMLWTRPRYPEPGALPGRAGEKAGSHGGLDAPAAVAAGGSVAGMLGPDLASVGAAPWQECRDAGDDRDGSCIGVGSLQLFRPLVRGVFTSRWGLRHGWAIVRSTLPTRKVFLRRRIFKLSFRELRARPNEDRLLSQAVSMPWEQPSTTSLWALSKASPRRQCWRSTAQTVRMALSCHPTSRMSLNCAAVRWRSNPVS